VTLRAATLGDRDFMLDLFASTRSLELDALDQTQRQEFVKMQFNIQQQSYSACYPAAENIVILLAEQPIGRMLVERSRQDILLVDIALLPDYRRQGIGSSLIQDLLNEAAASQKSVRLSVYRTNPAARLYQRLGFSKVGEEGLYMQMQWQASPHPA
jgi:ribosomal protein S18 acetylase RimI-like enzyme